MSQLRTKSELEASAIVIPFPAAPPEIREIVQPPHPWVYALCGGRVGRCPASKFRMPEPIGDSMIAGTAPIAPHALEMFPVMAEMMDRMLPWVPVFILPEALSHRGEDDRYAPTQRRRFERNGETYIPVGGTAWRARGWKRDVIVINGTRPPCDLPGIATHEALHIAYGYLSDEAKAVLESAAENGCYWPGPYLCSPEERVARMFEAWAQAHLEGMPGHVYDPNKLCVDNIFDTIWSGRLADLLIRTGRVQASHAVKARRGLLPPPPTFTQRACAWVAATVRGWLRNYHVPSEPAHQNS